MHASCHSASQTRAKALEVWLFLAVAVGRASGPSNPVKRLQTLRPLEARKLSTCIAPSTAVQSTEAALHHRMNTRPCDGESLLQWRGRGPGDVVERPQSRGATGRPCSPTSRAAPKSLAAPRRPTCSEGGQPARCRARSHRLIDHGSCGDRPQQQQP